MNRPLADDAAEESDVAEEHQQRENEGDRKPDRIARAELVERVVEPDHVRQQYVDRKDEDDDERERLQQPFRVGEEGRLFVAVVTLGSLDFRVGTRFALGCPGILVVRELISRHRSTHTATRRGLLAAAHVQGCYPLATRSSLWIPSLRIAATGSA